MKFIQSIFFIFITITSCLTLSVRAQFWKSALTEPQFWEQEIMALRKSGICYRVERVETIDPDLRYRQISYCCSGYRNLGTSKNLKCEPICKMDCSNGVCINPDQCECRPGFVFNNERCKSYNEE